MNCCDLNAECEAGERHREKKIDNVTGDDDRHRRNDPGALDQHQRQEAPDKADGKKRIRLSFTTVATGSDPT